MHNKKENCEKIVALLGLVILLYLIAPYFFAAFYANIAKDDFDNLNLLMYYAERGFIKSIYRYALHIYMRWQGTFTGNVLIPLGLYLYKVKGNSALHVEFLVVVTLYFVLVFVLIDCFVNKFAKKIERFTLDLMLMIVLTITVFYNCFQIRDIFYWHTSVAVYTIPLISSITSLIFLADSRLKYSIRYILSALFSFMSAGGALDIAALICTINLFAIAYRISVKRRYSTLLEFLPFVAAFIGALFNSFAPGNYVRYNGNPGINDLQEAITKSVSYVAHRNVVLIGEGGILLVMLSIVVAECIIQSDIKIINPIVLAGALFVGEVIIDFPVWLGAGRLRDRNEFVGKSVAVWFCFIFLLDFVLYVYVKFRKNFSHKEIIPKYIRIFPLYKGWVFIFTVVLFISLPYITDKNKEYYPYRIYNDIFSGKLKQYKEENNQVLAAIENGKKNTDVEAIVEGHVEVEYMEDTGLNDNPDNWVNVYVSDLYDFKSFKIVYK